MVEGVQGSLGEGTQGGIDLAFFSVLSGGRLNSPVRNAMFPFSDNYKPVVVHTIMVFTGT